MPTITQQDTKQIAHLARIQLSPIELEKYTGELNRIMGIIDAITQADTHDIEPMTYPFELTQPFREDVEVPLESEATEYDVWHNAPAMESGLYLVPKVVGE